MTKLDASYLTSNPLAIGAASLSSRLLGQVPNHEYKIFKKLKA